MRRRYRSLYMGVDGKLRAMMRTAPMSPTLGAFAERLLTDGGALPADTPREAAGWHGACNSPEAERSASARERDKSMRVFPVILSGGSGSRLWPLSRESFPKQLHAIAGEQTLLQQTAMRVSDRRRFEPLTVIANSEHRFQVAEQLRAAGADDAVVVLEPVGRGTAAAIAVAAAKAAAVSPDALILVMPADHFVADTAAFVAAVEGAAAAAMAGDLVLFGIQPTKPATGFGYIQAPASTQDAATAVRPVTAFVEKPDAATAEGYLQTGDYFWNSGIFLFSAAAIRAELAQYEPDVLANAEASLNAATSDLDFLRLEPTAFARCPSTSIDYAVFERTTRAVVAPVSFDWTDVGSWSSLWELGAKCGQDNVLVGDVQTHDTTGCYVRSEGPLVATIGVQDLVVVATPDAVLISSRAADQDVKVVVDKLRKANHATATQTRQVHRPWGSYEVLQGGERFQVKRITVRPGETLSLQKHFHRAEHWVVVNGTAQATIDGVEHLLTENQSIHVPLGAVHRLANPGRTMLNLIEVQSGAYLGEDDIVRYEDVYARA